jgi:hypothetical protein
MVEALLAEARRDARVADALASIDLQPVRSVAAEHAAPV